MGGCAPHVCRSSLPTRNVLLVVLLCFHGASLVTKLAHLAHQSQRMRVHNCHSMASSSRSPPANCPGPTRDAAEPERPLDKRRRLNGDPITLWTDCSGMEAPLMALRRLRLQVRQMAACDNDPVVQRFWRSNFADSGNAAFFPDLVARDHHRAVAQLGRPDIYVAGFPCPTFSSAGRHAGTNDMRGQLIVHILAFLEQAQPRVFLLENVCGLITHHPSVLRWILRALQELCGRRYVIYAHVLNNAESGIPHHRKRLWIVGIWRDALLCPLQWPSNIGCVPLDAILDPFDRPATTSDMPPASQTHARSNFARAFQEVCEGLHVNPLRSNIVADIDGSTGRGPHWMQGLVPCLTRTRCAGGGHWLMGRGRRLRNTEMLRLMGMRPQELSTDCVSDRQLRQMIGNSMGVNVLERILLRAVSASGLARLSEMAANWESFASASASVRALH